MPSSTNPTPTPAGMVKYLTNTCGLSQTELAQKLGVSQAWVSLVKRGLRSRLYSDSAEKLVRIYNETLSSRRI